MRRACTGALPLNWKKRLLDDGLRADGVVGTVLVEVEGKATFLVIDHVLNLLSIICVSHKKAEVVTEG